MKISEDEVIIIIKDKFGVIPKNIFHITGKGITNAILKIDLGKSIVILRMNDKSSIAQFEKEAWCIEQAIGLNIPSPKVLYVGVHNEYAYMIQDYIEGTNGEDSTIDKTQIWKQLGQYAKKIHAINTLGWGEKLMDKRTKKFGGSWKDYIQYEISSLTSADKLVELGVFDIEQSKVIKNIFEKLDNKEFTFGLNHGDLSLNNTIVNDDVMTLLDWGSAESHIVPHFDFVEILQSSLDEDSTEFISFLEGYGMSEFEFSKIRDEVIDLMILRRIDKVRWAIDRRPELVGRMVEEAKGVIKKKFENLKTKPNTSFS